MNDNVTFTMAMNGTSQDATTYVNGITTVAIYLLANTDEK